MSAPHRLQAEIERLYACPPAAREDGSPPGVEGAVRGVVLSVGAPADWGRLGAVWQGVQADLGLPAPGIAVSGTDALQLWFSLQQPVPATQALAFVEALRQRWLADLPAHRVAATLPAAPWPPQALAPDQWSAFVAPDLAPLFADTPWLDIPPGEEGQAHLLSSLASISPAAWRTATAALQAPAAAPAAPPIDTLLIGPQADARSFLQAVMNDERVALALRIDAAKALLLAGG